VSREDIIAIGEAFEDQIFTDFPCIPGTGREIKTDRFVKTIGGGVVITAIAASRFKLRCRVISGLSPLAVKRSKMKASLYKISENLMSPTQSVRPLQGIRVIPGYKRYAVNRLSSEEDSRCGKN
jgi:hypothetical protein